MGSVGHGVWFLCSRVSGVLGGTLSEIAMGSEQLSELAAGSE